MGRSHDLAIGWGLALVLLALPAQALTNHDASTAYHSILSYLRSLPEEAWVGTEGGGLYLAEAVRADPSVLGPRAATYLASLGLHSPDARARRVHALAALGVDLSLDIAALSSELSQSRPNRIALDASLRQSPRTKAGATGHRIPSEIENALAGRALTEAGVSLQYRDAVEDAILYLLEFQLPDGSWPAARYTGEGVQGEPVGDLVVTAEAVRALLPFRNATFSAPHAAAAASLGINTDIGKAIDDATLFLRAVVYAGDPVARAATLLAFLEGGLVASDPAVQAARDELVAMSVASGHTFDDSPFAAALAAQALGKASAFAQYEFDRDNDGEPDGSDPDADGDGVCDPGESGPGCTGTDAFPFDPNEDSDLDGDGIGDNADPDDDGDGYCDPGASGDSCEGTDAFPFDATEHDDGDLDGQGSVADTDDDNDGISDVDELTAGLDPNAADTDGDSFSDLAELTAGTNGADADEYPPPDGDIYPLGAHDGVVDLRDVLLAVRVASDGTLVPTSQMTGFLRHGDGAPTVGGEPNPDGVFDAADVQFVVRRHQEADE